MPLTVPEDSVELPEDVARDAKGAVVGASGGLPGDGVKRDDVGAPLVAMAELEVVVVTPIKELSEDSEGSGGNEENESEENENEENEDEENEENDTKAVGKTWELTDNVGSMRGVVSVGNSWPEGPEAVVVSLTGKVIKLLHTESTLCRHNGITSCTG